MRTKILLSTILVVFVCGFCIAQNSGNNKTASTEIFDYNYWKGVANKKGLDANETNVFIENEERLFNDKKNGISKPPSTFSFYASANTLQKGYNGGTANIINGPCTNVDFETGNLTGWTALHGYHPSSPNMPTCCPLAGGKQVVVSGGTDPHGGFPMVYPGGGGFSVKIGDDTPGNDNAEADRIEQTFSVTAANANFTYRYAVVLENPAGHSALEQPAFEIQMLTVPGGTPIPCTYYQVVSSATAVGFFPSLISGSVRYKPWTSVAVDLTPMIGQNVTIRFTVMDCSLNGHFGYAYIDGLCTNFATTSSDTTCANIPFQMCAPVGFSSYTWTAPGGATSNNQCLSASAPGVYTCQTNMSAGCMGPDFTHTLVALSVPTVSYTTITPTACGATQYTFTGTSGIASGTIASYTWDFGDGSVITSASPPPPQIHNFPGSGIYKVKFKAVSTRGCMDSLVRTYTVFPFPVIAYSPPSNCINTVVQFTNSSYVTMGVISSYSWTLGNGATSNVVNPTNTYTANGTYNISLSATSDQGCTSTLNSTLGIFPPPIISFTANNLCDANGTAFTPATSTAIVSGSLTTFLWDFGDGGTSTAANPTHTYTSPNTYTVNFSAVSNHNCSASVSNSFIISPSPSVAFVTTSLNACAPNFTFTSTTGIAFGSATYSWNFGGGNTSTLSNPTYTFPGIGNYTVNLTGVSNMNCITTRMQTITIYPYPVITMSVPASCENAVFNVTTTAVSGSVTSYNWDFGDPGSGASNTSTLQNPTHFYSSTNNYSITLNLISNLNCPSTSVTPIVVFPNPSASMIFTTASNCALPFTFDGSSSTVSTIGASAITNYKWSFGAGGTSSLPSGSGNFPGNGNYSVSLIVTTNHNCSDTVSTNYLVHPFPTLGYTLTPSCLNVPMNIISSSSISPVPTASASIASYTWNFGDATFDTSPSPGTHTYVASGIYTVSFGATSNKGCSSSLSKTVEIYALPTSSFTASGNMCFGNTTQFTSTNSIASSSIFAYDWVFGDGTNASGSAPSVSHTYAASGSFPVNFITTSNYGCLTVVTKTVTIHPLPVASFTVNNGCLNTATQFTDNSTVSLGSITSFTWDLGNGLSSNLQNPLYTYTLHGTYVPTLTIESNQNCFATTTKSVVIHPLPDLAFNPSSGCEGSVIQFTNSSTVALGTINSYTWDFGNSNSSNLNSPSQTYSYAAINQGIYTVTLSATTDQGCTRSSTTNLSIYPYPSVSLTPVNNSCINDAVTFTPNVTIPLGTINSYTWTYGDGITSTVVVSAPTITTTAAHSYTAYNNHNSLPTNNQYTVTLSALSDHGCYAIGTSTVKVYPKPIPSFTLSNFCFLDNLQCTNTSSIATAYSINTHYWEFYDGASGFSTVKSPNYVYTSVGTKTVQLTETSEPETGLFCSASISKTLTINPLPSPTFTTDKVCAGAANSFTNTTTGTSTITAWSWDFMNNGTVNSINANPGSFTYPAAGTYTAKLSARSNFNCLNEVTNTVLVHPNPVVSFTAPPVCFGGSSNFSEASTIALGSINSYSWNFGDGNGSSAQNPPYTYTAHGTYTVNLSVTSNQNCVSSSTNPITVHPLPTVIFSPPSQCAGTVQFVNSSTIALGSISSYTWNLGNGNISSLQNPSESYAFQASNQGLYTVSLTALSNLGCIKTSTSHLQIYPFPQVSVTPVNNSCIYDAVTFTPNITIPLGTMSSYTWTFGDGITNSVVVSVPSITTPAVHSYTAHNNHISVPANNQFTVTLSALSNNNCPAIATTTVKVFPRPIPNFSLSNFCFDDNMQFTNLSTIPGGFAITTHTWDFGDGTLSNSVSTTYKYTAPGTQTVQLTEASEPEPGLFCSASTSKTVTINPLPDPSFTSNKVCFGSYTSYSNTSAGNIVAWSWDYKNDGSVNSVSGTNNVYLFPGPGTYTTKLTARTNFNCFKSFSDTVRVYANPTASFVANATCLGGTTNFTNLSTYGSGAPATHTWIISFFDFATTPQLAYNFSVAGTYSVELNAVSNLGCSNKYVSNVTVYDTPQASFSVANTCVNQNTAFNNSSSISTGSISIWKWDFENDGKWDDSTHFSPTTIYPGIGSYTVRLQVGSSSQCINEKTNSLIIHASPNADFTYQTLCEKEEVTFTNLSNCPDGRITSFKWDFQNDRVIDRESADGKFTYPASGTYTNVLQVATEFGCIDTALKLVTVNPKGVPIFTSDKTDGCPNDCISFKNLSYISTGSITSFQWDFGDGSQKISDQPNTLHCYKTGIYNLGLSVTSDMGCTSTLSAPGYISMHDKPKAAFVVDPEELDEDLPTIDVRSSAIDAINTRYYISDGTNYNKEGFSHNFKNLDSKTKPMVVQVVKNKYGCADTVYKILPIKPAFALYFPNIFTPNGDGVNDDFEPKGIGVIKFHLQIFDRWGHLEFETNDMGVKWNGKPRTGEGLIKQDVYVWKAEASDVFSKRHVYTGQVTVLK